MCSNQSIIKMNMQIDGLTLKHISWRDMIKMVDRCRQIREYKHLRDKLL